MRLPDQFPNLVRAHASTVVGHGSLDFQKSSVTTLAIYIVTDMERRAYGVLGGKVERIKASNVDPAWLAEKLVSAKIVGKLEEERAREADVPEAQRRGKLVEMVQGNGRRGVFQTFVNILLNEPHLEWLGEELKGRVYL